MINLAELLGFCQWCWLRHVEADESEHYVYSGGGA